MVKKVNSSTRKQVTEEAAIKSAGITVQTLFDARKTNNLVQSLNFGSANASDAYRVKYLGKDALGTTPPYNELVLGNDGSHSLISYPNADEFIRDCFKNSNKYILKSGNVSLECVPGVFNKFLVSPYIKLDAVSKKILESQKNLMVVADVIEVGYDSVKNQYYVRGSKIDELQNCSFKNLSSVTPVKYIALTRLIIRPHYVTPEEQAVIAAGIPIMTVNEAKLAGLYVQKLPKVPGAQNIYENMLFDPTSKYYNKYTPLFDDCDLDLANDYSDDWIRLVFNCNSLYKLVSDTDSDSYVCANYKFEDPVDHYMDEPFDVKVKSGEKMLYALQVAEIGYDNVNKKFYIRKITNKFYESAYMVKNDVTNKFNPYKYIARLEQVAEPKN